MFSCMSALSFRFGYVNLGLYLTLTTAGEFSLFFDEFIDEFQ